MSNELTRETICSVEFRQKLVSGPERISVAEALALCDLALRALEPSPEREPIAWMIEYMGEPSDNIFMTNDEARQAIKRLNLICPEDVKHRRLLPLYGPSATSRMEVTVKVGNVTINGMQPNTPVPRIRPASSLG